MKGRNKCIRFTLAERVFRFVSGMLILAVGFLGGTYPSFAQTPSPKPAPPSIPYTNSVHFDFSQNIFEFYYQDANGRTLNYEYRPTNRGTFRALQCVVDGSYRFYPSGYGGLSIPVGDNEIPPWDPNLNYTLVNLTAQGDTLTADWQVSYMGQNPVPFRYRFSISGRTLVIDIYSNGAASVLLDRCDQAQSPVVLPIPYLPLMNVLYTGGVFVSMFFDWEITEAAVLSPIAFDHSSTSVGFAQNARYYAKTDGSRRAVQERLYLTVSPKLDEVLPEIQHPPSPYKSVSANYLVLDLWTSSFWLSEQILRWFKAPPRPVEHLWVIQHTWQYGGYDNMYPDVLPASPFYGGESQMHSLSQVAALFGYLFALHENYMAFYPNAPSWNPGDLALNSDGSWRIAWNGVINPYQTKPNRSAYYLNIFAPQIHQAYHTTASYLDVHTGVNPSSVIDMDASIPDGDKFTTTLWHYRRLAEPLRRYHQGPVSGEGNYHFLYAGYYDDFEAQINSGKGAYWQGVRLPLLVDFKLRKLHPLVVMHGVGLYERFFSDEDGNPLYETFPIPYSLVYIATELAYGNGGFIPTPDRTDNILSVGRLEYRHVLPVQRLIANARVVSITYNDYGQEVSASEYIHRHPITFMEYNDPDFMSQVRVTYDNGVVVCVNRNPVQTWQVSVGSPGGWFNYHAIINGVDSLFTGLSNQTSYQLPPLNGWVVFSPQPPNIFPVITSTPDTLVVPGQSYTYSVQASDPDGDPLTYDLVAAPAWLDIDTHTGIIEGTPSVADTGDNLITIQVNDNRKGFVRQSFLLKVTQDTTFQGPGGNIPRTYALDQNYPNPFNARTRIHFSLPEKQHVTLKVFDILGREVATLVDEERPAGNYTVVFDATELASGIYFYRLKAGPFTQSRKAILMK